MPCSKELFPIGFEGQGAQHPKAVATYLLERYRQAGVRQVYFILRDGKWDIPAYYGDGSRYGIQLAYLLMQRPYGCPYSVGQAYTFVRGQRVLFGFPDILFEPEDAFVQLLQRQKQTQADVVLGCFSVEDSRKWDMVQLAEDGAVRKVLPKPAGAGLKYNWAIACWSPAFTEFMQTYLQQQEQALQRTGAELPMGAVVQAALEQGLLVQSVCFEAGSCLDVGTPEDLRRAIRSLT